MASVLIQPAGGYLYARGAEAVVSAPDRGWGVPGFVNPWSLVLPNFFYQSIAVEYRFRSALYTMLFPPSFPPSFWFDSLHMVLVLSRVSWPPWLAGVMWSTSTLFGSPACSHSSQTPHSGQFVSPFSRSIARR